MTVDEQRAGWDTAAPAWRRWRDTIERHTLPVMQRMLDLLDPQPGETILDTAAGAGAAGFAALEKVGGSAHLITTDFSPAMVEEAQLVGKSLGLHDVRYAVMNAQELDLEDDVVDAAICRYGLMLMPEPHKAIAEARRVVKPGGRYVSAVWAGPDRNPWITALGMASMQNDLVPPGNPFEPGGLFSLSDKSLFSIAFESSGFETVDIEEVVFGSRFSSFDEYWDHQSEVAGSLAAVLREATDEKRAAVRNSVAEIVAPFTTESGLSFPATALVARAS